jgi:Tfp pilus assembly protein PilF
MLSTGGHFFCNRTLFIAMLLFCLAACDGNATKKDEHPPPTEAEKIQQAGNETLTRGIAQFDAGSYADAEATFLSLPIWEADDAIKIKALKYLAFTYCVTDRPTSCKQAFERALQLDSGFDLAVSESSHPLWGPQFKTVKTTNQKTP